MIKSDSNSTIVSEVSACMQNSTFRKNKALYSFFSTAYISFFFKLYTQIQELFIYWI